MQSHMASACPPESEGLPEVQVPLLGRASEKDQVVHPTMAVNMPFEEMEKPSEESPTPGMVEGESTRKWFCPPCNDWVEGIEEREVLDHFRTKHWETVREEFANAGAEVAKLQEEKASLVSTMEALAEDRETVKVHWQEAEHRADELDERLGEMAKRLDQSAIRSDKRRDAIDKLKRSNRELETFIENESTAKGLILAQLDAKILESDTWEGKAALANEKVADLEVENARARRHLEEAEGRDTVKGTELIAARKEIGRLKAERNDTVIKLNNAQVSLEKTKRENQERGEQISHLARLLTDVSAREETLRDELSAIGTASDDLKEAQDHITSLQVTITNLDASMVALKADHQRDLEALKEKTDLVTSLRVSVADFEATGLEAGKELKRMASLITKAAEREERLQERVKTLTQEAADLQKDLTRYVEEVRAKNDLLTAHEDSIADLEANAGSGESKIARLTAIIAEAAKRERKLQKRVKASAQEAMDLQNALAKYVAKES